MPSSFIHLCVAKEIVNKISVDEEQFLYGNILPDYIKNKTDYKTKDKLHFYRKTIVNGITKKNVDIEEFLNTYGNEIKDSVSLGIYSHFMTDHFWINKFIKNHLVKENEIVYLKTTRGLIRNNRITVYRDYDRMLEWIVNNYNLSIEFIKNVNYNGFFSNIYGMPKEKIYNKMNEYMNQARKEEMEIFTKEEIEEFVEETSQEVLKRLKEIM